MTGIFRCPVPLTAEEAYWHACTGTPIPEDRYLSLLWDSQCLRSDRLYFLSPELRMKRVAEWDLTTPPLPK